LLRALTNLIYKNREKMTTNQTTETLHMIRQAMLYPANSNIQKRLQGLHENIREQIEAKIFKTSIQRLLFMMLQDRYTRDSHKLINGSKELKGNIIKSMMQHVNLLNSQADVTLISVLFPKEHFEEAKFISIALGEMSKLCKHVKESFAKKKQHNEELWESLFTVEKLIYLVCIHEAQSAVTNQLSPGLI
jgi:hypothetical protein